MTTENLQTQLALNADGSTEPWYTHLYGNISFSIEWTGATALTGVVEIQNSLDQVNWNCYGGDQGSCTLDAATGYQVFEIVNRASPYFRVRYTKNTETTGNMVIRTYGTPLHRMT